MNTHTERAHRHPYLHNFLKPSLLNMEMSYVPNLVFPIKYLIGYANEGFVEIFLLYRILFSHYTKLDLFYGNFICLITFISFFFFARVNI